MIRLVTSFLLLLTAPLAFAQMASPMPGMDHSQPTKVIDGEINPELIPDLTAYRLFFLANSELPNPTSERRLRQQAFLGKMGVTSLADTGKAVQILEKFKVRYTALTGNYNDMVSAAALSGSPAPDQETFLKQRDLLVQQTRDELNLNLSAPAMKQFDAQVQSEKRGMRIVAKEGQ